MTTPGETLLVLQGQGDGGEASARNDHPVFELIRQAFAACDAELHLAALFVALSLPDVCAALSAGNARSNGAKYKQWMKENGFDDDLAQRIYGLRCSLLHQGSALPDKHVIPVAFVEPAPGRSTVHYIETEVAGAVVLWLGLRELIEDLEAAVHSWWTQHGQSGIVQKNLESLARRRPTGLPPHLTGAPVIA